MKRLAPIASLVVLFGILAALLPTHTARAVGGIGPILVPMSSGAFTPISLGPVAWYKSDTGVTQAASLVTQWNDQSGNGYNLTVDVGNGATPPAYATGGVAGLPQITFTENGTTGLKSTSCPSALNQDMFVIGVTQAASAASNDYLVDMARSAGTGIELYQQQSGNVLGFSMGGSQIFNSQGTAIGVPFIVEAQANGGSTSAISFNASANVTGNIGAGGTSTEISVGHAGGGLTGSSAFAWGGQIYEVFVTPYILSAPQRANLLGYFRARYYPSPESTGLVTWLRADQVVSPVNGAQFSQWTDLSNGGATYTQSTMANQFVWNAHDALFGGKPSVTGTGIEYVATTVNAVTMPYTIYFVQTLTPSVPFVQIGVTDVADDFEVVKVGTAYGAWNVSGNSGNFGNGITPDTSPHVTASVVNGSSSYLYLDSSSANVATGSVVSVNITSDITFGRNAGSFSISGNVPEMIFFQGAHTAADVAANFAYLSQRYNKTWN